MLKRFVASAFAALSVAGSGAVAGEIYMNPEYNAGFAGSEFSGSTLEGHIGYEEGPWYIQAGPALSNNGTESDWGFSGKTGLSGAVTSKMDLYTEVSFSKFDGTDTNYGLKVGGKYKF
jgi:hypothetical protein|tara:strand:- start:178 stop:531 length:354 start_codon:yes stop_codon:yes gene_type:complete